MNNSEKEAHGEMAEVFQAILDLDKKNAKVPERLAIDLLNIAFITNLKSVKQSGKSSTEVIQVLKDRSNAMLKEMASFSMYFEGNSNNK